MQPTLTSLSAATRIALLFMFLMIGLILATGMITLFDKLVTPGEMDELTRVYTGTLLQSLIAIAAPAVMLAFLTEKFPAGSLGMTGNRRMGRGFAYALAIFFFSYPTVSFLTQMNSQMILPDAFSELAQTLRSMEDAAMETTTLILSVEHGGGLLLNLLLIALLPAVTEELFFRGALQQLLHRWLGNGHVAVWIAAAIFSLIHFQFYGFLPRMVLGALLGTLFLYSHNLWIPILFHFVNNATVILLHFFWGDAYWLTELDEMPLTLPFLLTAVGGALVTLLLFYHFRKKSTLPAVQQNKNKNKNNDTNRKYTTVG